MTSDNRTSRDNAPITSHFGVSILLPCDRDNRLTCDPDGSVHQMSGAVPLPAWQPVFVARATQNEFNVPLLKRFDPDGKLLDDFALADALEQGDRQRAKSIVSGERWAEDIRVTCELRIPMAAPEDVFALHVTDALKETRFVIWRDERTGKLRPGILCQNARQAAYALLVARLGQPGNWSVCKRCGKFFRKRRSAQPYCSSRCRVNEAMKRYRARKAKVRRKKRRSKR